jgi:hypothetical protein
MAWEFNLFKKEARSQNISFFSTGFRLLASFSKKALFILQTAAAGAEIIATSLFLWFVPRL